MRKGFSATCLVQFDRVLPELLVNQTRDQLLERLPRLGQNEVVLLVRPVELEAGGQRRDPDLAHGSVGRDDELRGRLVEADVNRARTIFHLEVSPTFGGIEAALEVLECRVRAATKILIVHELIIRLQVALSL